MKLRNTLFAGCLLMGLSLGAQERVSLNGTWSFALAKTAKEAEHLEDFHRPDFKGRSFKDIPVPSNWAVLGFEEPVYRGYEGQEASEGFYLHDFATPKGYDGQRVLLHFGGVWSSAEVWLNGEYLGVHESGYTSFAFDVTGRLKKDGLNRLAVRVRQTTTVYQFDTFDDWTLGGIYRDVELEAMPKKRWLDPLVTRTTFDKAFKDAELEVCVMVNDNHKNTRPGNYPSPGEAYSLRFTLSTLDGREVQREEMTVPAHTSTGREFKKVMHVDAPLHWTAETPNLYQLQVDLLEGSQVTHSRKERIGFRQVSTEGGVFRINGQAVKLRGINRHDEHPDVGRATRREHWLEDIRLMKEANINYVRTSHYTPAEGFIELCDSLGLYVGSEVSMGGGAKVVYNPVNYDASLERAYETIIRDINNPSIVYWSVSNESPLTTMHMASVKLVKAIDPTRPVLLPWRFEDWLPEEVDILDIHYWKPAEYDSLVARSTRPVMTTEYTHAYGTEGYGSLKARWRALAKHPAGMGGAIWMWADQGLKTPTTKPKKDLSDDPHLRINGKGWDGIVDSYRRPTADYWETKGAYAQVYPAVESVVFTPGQATVRIPLQNDYDFTDLSSLKIHWSLWEDGRQLAASDATVSGGPHTEAALLLPLDKLGQVTGGKTYYVQLAFTDATGFEVNRQAVELCPRLAQPTAGEATHKPVVTQGETVKVAIGDAAFVFNPKTGQLDSATKRGKELITDLRPILWHRLDHSESSAIGKVYVRRAANLNKYTPHVRAWNVTEQAGAAVITAHVDYAVNDSNRFAADYRYTLTPDGRLQVHYSFRPEVTIPCLPIVGMSLQSAPTLDTIHWLGLGPYDAYPNKCSASYLGYWGGKAGQSEVTGTKATRRIERSGADGTIRITHEGYMEHKADAPHTLHILSGVLGRTEKGRRAEESVPQLSTTGEPFVGELCIELL